MSQFLRIHRFCVTMSSRSTYRSGRNHWRRNFSERPPHNDNGGDQFVTGDSHIRSVRDSNTGFRRGNFYNQVPPPPSYNHQFRQPPPYNRNPPFRQPRPFVQNQPVRPRAPKPLDYRDWEPAKTAPPPDSDRFLVLSYNILADYLALSHRGKLYYHIPRYILDWQWRKKCILFELGLWGADIMCFQEVDRFQDLEQELRVRGYSGIWKMRTGSAVDGCAIFWRASRFKLLFEESIEYNKLGLRDNVAQICVLELVNQKHIDKTATLPTSSPCHKVVICNIHVLYNPKRGEIKLGQVRTLLDKAYSVSKIWDNAPVVLCGDFNCTPKSPLYNFISEKKLDLSGVDRDKVSGQASAEIRPLKPQTPYTGAQSVDGSMQTPSVVGGESSNGVQPIDPASDVQNTKNEGNENFQYVNEMSPSQNAKMVLGYDKACEDMQVGKDNIAIVDEARKDSEQSEGNGFNGETRSADSLKENGSCLRREVRFPSNEGVETTVNFQEISRNESKTDVVIQEMSTLPQSHPESKSDLPEVGKEEKTNAAPFNHGSKIERSDSFINQENATTNADDSACPPISHDPTSIDILVTDPLEKLSLINLDEPRVEGECVNEDENAFISALHGTEDASLPNVDQSLGSTLSLCPGELIVQNPDDLPPSMDSEVGDMEKTTYDPSLWTPMEIATATGSEDCTYLEHPLHLTSTYAEAEDRSGTRDTNGEPLVTSYNRCFLGTVDYIWHSEGLQTVRVLAPIPKHAMQWTPGFPTKKWGSDHIALASEMAFTKP